ncbi:MAG: hypothetical protein JWN30_1271 [Bacilli bacterium]|nr:hypothetical protein [Bacilli bacterium]
MVPRKRRNNELNVQTDWTNEVQGVVSLAEAKELFLKEIRGLAAQPNVGMSKRHVQDVIHNYGEMATLRV